MLIFSLNRVASIVKCLIAAIIIPAVSVIISYVFYEFVRAIIVGYIPDQYYWTSFISNGFVAYITLAGWMISIPILLVCLFYRER